MEHEDCLTTNSNLQGGPRIQATRNRWTAKKRVLSVCGNRGNIWRALRTSKEGSRAERRRRKNASSGQRSRRKYLAVRSGACKMQTSSQRRTLSAGGAERRRKEEEPRVGTVFKKRQPPCLLGTLGYGRGWSEPDGGGAKGEGGMQIKGAREALGWGEMSAAKEKETKEKRRALPVFKGPENFPMRACVFIAFLKTQFIKLKCSGSKAFCCCSTTTISQFSLRRWRARDKTTLEKYATNYAYYRETGFRMSRILRAVQHKSVRIHKVKYILYGLHNSFKYAHRIASHWQPWQNLTPKPQIIRT